MEFKNVSKNALKRWLVFGMISLIFHLAITFVIILLYTLDIFPYRIAVILLTIFISLGTIWSLVDILKIRSIRYNNMKYHLNTDRIELTSGVFILTHQIVPFVRMQHVEVLRLPSDRIFKMSTLIIHTAGSSINIGNLDVNVAETLLKEIRESLDKLKVGDNNDK